MTTVTDSAGNVTSLRRKRRARKPASRARALLEQCRDRLRKHMQGALPGIMDQVDDALFDLANKADTNQLQSAYFEAMRSVRLCRDEIETRFGTGLDAAMTQRCAAGPGSVEPDADRPGGALSLTLVDQDDLEETVAVKNIAGKICNLCHEDLFALDRRVGLLLGSPTLEGEENPLGPYVLCSAARDAVDVIDASVEIRLLVLKLFDRHLTRAAEQFYPQVNAWLVREGVLPNVHTALPLRDSRGRQPHPGRDRGASQSVRGHDPWERRRGDGETAAGWAGYHGDVAHDGERAGARNALAPQPGGIRGEQVLGVLDEVMRVGGGTDAGDGVAGREQFIGNLTSLQRDGAMAGTGNVVRELRSSGAASGVSHSDSLMIDVVAMMFDFILEDENIGDAMRALIGRLQIPVLKVAILDKSFFARRSHPARSFINTLAEFGAHLSSDDQEHTAALAEVRILVRRILDEFEEQLDVFAGALEELEAIVAREDDAARRNASSSNKVAQERERLARARRIADDEVEERLEHPGTPEVVVRFLREHWRFLLGERLFREGEQGDAWRAGLQTLEQLLWSVTPKHDGNERKRLLAMLPILLERLKGGMRELGMAVEARAPFMQAFSDLHIAALRGDERPAGGKPAPEAAPASVPAVTPAPERLPEALPEPIQQPGARARRLLHDAVERANDLVWSTAEERPQCQGMGTTVVALKLDGDCLVCAHAGDSRLYRMRDGALAQLSDDHTYRREVVLKGLVSEEDAAGIANNMITRAVGGDASIKVDVNVHDTAPGDLFLCCSDGLSDMIDDAHIARVMQETPALEALAGALIAAANSAGGRDNISVGLLRVNAALPEPGAGEPRDYGAFVSIGVATNPGRRRAHNEDCIECDQRLGVMVLADGMGGHNAGEVASAMTVKLVLEEARAAAALAEAGAPAGAVATGHGSGDAPEFDFDAISAVFWGDQVPGVDNRALHDAVGEEVQSIIRSAGEDLDIFDLDVGAETGPGILDSDVVHDAARDPLLDRVLKLKCGTWVEFGEQRGKGVRARLSWIAAERARYLFTDRMGQKVSDATPYGMAVELRCGRMRVLDDAPLFDRAVSSLTRRLRSPEPCAPASP